MINSELKEALNKIPDNFIVAVKFFCTENCLVAYDPSTPKDKEVPLHIYILMRENSK